MNYCDAEDIFTRLEWYFRRHELFALGANILFVGLTDVTKRSHDISGWMAITGEDSLGVVFPLLDVFVGLKFENQTEIADHLKAACFRLPGVDFKIM